jgi:uncharacterized protein YbjT (DUF2867 family)
VTRQCSATTVSGRRCVRYWPILRGEDAARSAHISAPNVHAHEGREHAERHVPSGGEVLWVSAGDPGGLGLPNVPGVRLLVTGGTSFVGRHAVALAVAGGHEVAVFHRGRTNPDLLQGRIEHLFGDRDTGDYTALAGAETWDAAVDVSAFVPRHVHQLADVVQGRIGHYVQVSSVSAYDSTRATVDEDSPLHPDPAEGAEIVDPKSYGPLKAACERAAVSRFGESTTAIVRPAYVCGPHDNEDNFTYWARRMAEGGDVVVRDASAPMQIIDVRDLGGVLAPVRREQGGGGVRRGRTLRGHQRTAGRNHPPRASRPD